jgi:hypothetical protein
MYKLSFFVPEKNCEEVKQALFAVGVGKIGNYDCCCWQTIGQGQFRPLQGANPTLGKIGEIEYLQEMKVEMVCEESLIKLAVEVLKKSHPYEEVAYEVFKLEEF